MFKLTFPFQMRRSAVSVLFAWGLALATVLAAPFSAGADTGFSGKVTDMALAPLSGVEVQLLDTAGNPAADVATTLADGTYTVGAIGAGAYKVSFLKRVDISDTTPAVYYNNRLSLGTADTLTIVSGVMTPNINAVIGSWGIIAGKVVNAAGTPIQGISVNVCDAAGQAIPSVPAALTDAQGNYHLAPVARGGNYLVRFNGTSQYAGQLYNNAGTPIPISVSASLTTSLASTTLQAVSVSGRVSNASGAGIPNIQVYLYDASLNYLPAVLTGSDGTYSMIGIAPGTYGVLFQDPTLVYKKQYYNLQSTRPPPSITVSTGTPLTGINAVLMTVPGAPSGVSAAAGNGQATVSFAAPASNGGSAITSYKVTSTPGSITATGSASPITVSGLANGTPYTFTVTASNAIGTGPISMASNSVTPVANGACGSANGASFVSAPASNLCSTGVASSVTGTGPWGWSCAGSTGGTTATCSASLQTFTLTAGVTGGGTVTSSPAGIACVNGSSSGCSTIVPGNSLIDLFASPDANSIFEGWSGDCQGTGGCSVSMAANRSVTATFVAAPNAKIGADGYSTLSAACTAAGNGATILARDIVFPENVIFSNPITALMSGGYDAAFGSHTGNPTTITGSLKIRSGRLTVDRVFIR